MQPQLVSINGKGVFNSERSKRKRENSPFNNLELGIGSYGGGLNSVIKEEEEDKVVFTEEQFQEFQFQVVIFRYMISGLPVPFHLVLPLWKRVKTGIHDQFSSFLGLTTRDIDHWRMMDSEPGRCRRTDGKKWRCYKSVVPHQKYCEKHMHRGCQRSRKCVEISESTSKSNDLAINSGNFESSVISSGAATADCGVSASVSTSLNLTMSCSNAIKSVPGTFEGGSTSYTGNDNWKSKSENVVRVENGTCTSSLVRVLADKNNIKYEINYTGDKVLNFNHTNGNRIDWNYPGNKHYADASVAPIFGLSPKSVLQGGKAAGCSRLNFGSNALAETDSLRCRRTDGKKWRCSKDVVPDKKYCEAHLHRGSKKAMTDSKLVTDAPAAPFSRIGSRCIPAKVDNIINMNTNLSISMAASPQKTSDGDSSSFSSSDATTVTDENGSIAHLLTLSP